MKLKAVQRPLVNQKNQEIEYLKQKLSNTEANSFKN
jgi:hypothetical protein